MTTTKWRILVRQLRHNFPVVGGVVHVRRCPIKGCCGVTIFNGLDFRIRIDSKQAEQGQIDTLLHEWAHVLAIVQAYRHEGPWGTLYAEIYDLWTNDFEDKG